MQIPNNSSFGGGRSPGCTAEVWQPLAKLGWVWSFSFQEGEKAKPSICPVFELFELLVLILLSGPEKVAPIPPFLSRGRCSLAEPSWSESSGRLFHSSFSCCFSSGSPALSQCQRKTTAVPFPTILPDHSTPCSDTQMARLHSEPRRCHL